MLQIRIKDTVYISKIVKRSVFTIDFILTVDANVVAKQSMASYLRKTYMLLHIIQTVQIFLLQRQSQPACSDTFFPAVRESSLDRARTNFDTPHNASLPLCTD